MNDFGLDRIEYCVKYSSRKTLGISVKRDASVIVRVPYGTSAETILKLINDKKKWILKHSAWFRQNNSKAQNTYTQGENHLFRGKYLTLHICLSEKPYCLFNDEIIELGTKSMDSLSVREVLYNGYRKQALKIFPAMLEQLVRMYNHKELKPSGLRIRTMKSRWGSCSRRGLITLNSDLIRLDDTYIVYVMKHELCHLQHHNHGKGYYLLLSEICPDWKKIKHEMRKYAM